MPRSLRDRLHISSRITMASRTSSTVGLVPGATRESASSEPSISVISWSLEPHKRPKNDDPSLANAVEGLKKGQNVRIPGLLDERIEDCGPNRNCYAAVARERNASKPPLEEFLSRFLGT